MPWGGGGEKMQTDGYNADENYKINKAQPVTNHSSECDTLELD